MSSMQTSHEGRVGFTHKCANTDKDTHTALLCLNSGGICGHYGWDHALLPALPPSAKSHHLSSYIFLLCFSSLCFVSFKNPFFFQDLTYCDSMSGISFQGAAEANNSITSLWTVCYTDEFYHNNFDNYFLLMVAFFMGCNSVWLYNKNQATSLESTIFFLI